MALNGIVYMLLPVLAFLWLRRYRAARVYPAVTGAVIYFVTTRLSDLLAHLVGFSADYGTKAAIASEIVCVFEEAGRYLAMRYPVTDIRKPNAAVCYGIGHGGLECWIRGVQTLSLIGSAEKAAPLALLDAAESTVLFCVQIAFSLLIFRRIQAGFPAWRAMLPAVLLHYAVNGSGWLISFTGNAYLSAVTGIAAGLAVIFAADRIADLRESLREILYPLDDET